MDQIMNDTWKLTLPCTRAEAEAISEDSELLSHIDPVPSIVAQEIEAFNDMKWEILAYFPEVPDKSIIALIRNMLPSSAKAKPQIEQVPDLDWLVESQKSLRPVHAGRFFVCTSGTANQQPQGTKAFVIEASQAFGTGGHETTSGCLEMLDSMRRSGKRFDHIADIGTGTGLLAFAAQYLWPHAYVTASDIDPVSIDVTRYNADLNLVSLGNGMGRIALCVAKGIDAPMIECRAPYDLIIANILSAPLITLSPAFASICAEGGSIILAGLLNTQAAQVIRAFRAQGFRLDERRDHNDWPTLRMTKRKRYGWRRPLMISNDDSQPPGDFGTW
jgi:ribosomal protein L11 methyltransferase